MAREVNSSMRMVFVEDSLKGVTYLIHLYLLDRPTAVTEVSRIYNGSNTFKFIFTHMSHLRPPGGVELCSAQAFSDPGLPFLIHGF